MAYDGWLKFGGVEIVNLSRTAQLAELRGISAVWLDSSSVDWIQTTLSGVGYDDVTEAPWFDPAAADSTEFAGVVPLSFPGLSDSTRASDTSEYLTDGGSVGRPRSGTLTIVASVAIAASTERGALYGLRWLNKVLSSGGSPSGASGACAGSRLDYFVVDSAGSPVAHRNDVAMTRGVSVTKKHVGDCSAIYMATFTLTAGDPFEYSAPVPVVTELSATATTGPNILASGSVALVQQSCPIYDYSPIFDPALPALVPAPSAPDFLPAGWNNPIGATFDRFWAKVPAVSPTALGVVPVVKLHTEVDARMVRLSIWPGDSAVTEQCYPLWSSVATFVPNNSDFYIDGEMRASYVWDGGSPSVRRADSLTYSADAQPIRWVDFNDHDSLLIALDVFSDSGGSQGAGTVKAAVNLVLKVG